MIKFSEISSDKTYCEMIAILLKDKSVEVYLGDTYEQIQRADSSESVNSVVIGKVVAGFKDCLVLDCQYVDGNKEYKYGNLVFINGWGIKAISQVDGKGSLADVFVSSKFSKKL